MERKGQGDKLSFNMQFRSGPCLYFLVYSESSIAKLKQGRKKDRCFKIFRRCTVEGMSRWQEGISLNAKVASGMTVALCQTR